MPGYPPINHSDDVICWVWNRLVWTLPRAYHPSCLSQCSLRGIAQILQDYLRCGKCEKGTVSLRGCPGALLPTALIKPAAGTRAHGCNLTPLVYPHA